MANRPSLEEFFSDPKHADDREFFTGLVEKTVQQMREKEAAEREKSKPKKPKSIWDSFFGPKDETE